MEDRLGWAGPATVASWAQVTQWVFSFLSAFFFSVFLFYIFQQLFAFVYLRALIDFSSGIKLLHINDQVIYHEPGTQSVAESVWKCLDILFIN